VARRNTYDVFDVSMQSPLASTDQIAGLLNTLAQTSCSNEHNIITARKSVAYDDDQLLAILNALEMLGFAGTSDRAVQLTPVGQHYVKAATHERRFIFAAQLMHLPSVKLIQSVIASHPGHQGRCRAKTSTSGRVGSIRRRDLL
jgi:NitT/TauT family transport system ATP-binding protein